jgi:arylsulfatase A-like enzyme
MVNEENVMLPEVLKDAGFQTAGFIGAFPLSERFGFAQGFDFFDETLEAPLPSTPELLNERPADQVTAAAVAHLDTTGIPDRLFLFVHYFDPHGPYRVRQPYHERYRQNDAVDKWLRHTQGVDMRRRQAEQQKANRYASEVSFMDHHVGRLLDYLRDRGILDDAIVVVTSDHGQNFVEHYRNFNHGFTVYQTTVGGLGLIRLPGALHGGTRVAELVSGIDILPTILAVLGVEIPRRVEGEAIEISASGVSVSPRVRFSQATKPFGEVEADVPWMNIRKARCIVSGDLKFIQTPYEDTEELYDLAADPFERRNLLERDPDMAETAQDLRRRLRQWAESANPFPQPDSTTISEESIKRLKSLGYLQ